MDLLPKINSATHKPKQIEDFSAAVVYNSEYRHTDSNSDVSPLFFVPGKRLEKKKNSDFAIAQEEVHLRIRKDTKFKVSPQKPSSTTDLLLQQAKPTPKLTNFPLISHSHTNLAKVATETKSIKNIFGYRQYPSAANLAN